MNRKSCIKRALTVLAHLVILSSCHLVIVSSATAQERTDAELEGVWDLEAIEIGDKKIDAPKGKGGSFSFTKDGKVLMKDPNKPDKHGKYKTDTGKNPKQLDLIESKDGKDGPAMRFIYEVEEDKLKMAYSAEGPKGPRPRAFKGDKVVIVYLVRQKS